MGPLAGTRVVEMAGLAPGPFAAMMLADMGAEVLRVVRALSAASAASARFELSCTAVGIRSCSRDHKVGRRTFVELDGIVQPAAAPRLSRGAGDADGDGDVRRSRDRAGAMRHFIGHGTAMGANGGFGR